MGISIGRDGLLSYPAPAIEPRSPEPLNLPPSRHCIWADRGGYGCCPPPICTFGEASARTAANDGGTSRPLSGTRPSR